MDGDAIQRRLAAVLSADAVGYSRLMADDPSMTVQTITAYREQIKLIADARGGHVVDSTGDNILIEFPAATSAAEAALEIQRVLEVRNTSLPEERRMEFRIGLHMGEVLAEGDRIYGDGVNIAARLEGMADPTGVVCSAAVRDQLGGQSVTFHDLGERDLKKHPVPDPTENAATTLFGNPRSNHDWLD